MDPVDLGEIVDDVWICCKGRHGCKKKYCCPGIVLFVIIGDLIGLVFIILEIIFPLVGEGIITIYPSSPDQIASFFKSITLIFIPIQLVYLVKCYTGLAWLSFNRRSRESYIRFYYTSLTFNFSVLALALELQFISFAFHDAMWDYIGYYQWFYVSWYMSECVVIEIYMRHLD